MSVSPRTWAGDNTGGSWVPCRPVFSKSDVGVMREWTMLRGGARAGRRQALALARQGDGAVVLPTGATPVGVHTDGYIVEDTARGILNPAFGSAGMPQINYGPALHHNTPRVTTMPHARILALCVNGH